MDLCMAVYFLFDIPAAFLCEEDKYEVFDRYDVDAIIFGK